mgnify:CR=1 FL=1
MYSFGSLCLLARYGWVNDPTTNMYLFDADERLRKYECVEDIVKDYYRTRIGMYRERIAYIVDVLERELCLLSNKAKYINENEAEEYIAGYCVVNDVSERAFQIKREGQWTKGKSCDTFGPTGPYLVTKDEIKDINNINLSLDVNGERRQTGNTKRMIFNFDFLISHISQFMTLYPGTIITTGTPAGTAMEMSEPKFLQSGDKLSLKVDYLGEQHHEIVNES